MCYCHPSHVWNFDNGHYEFPLNIVGYPLIWVHHLSFWPWHILAYMYIFHTHKKWLYMYRIYTCMYSYLCVMIMSHKPDMFASFTREGPIYQGNWADHEMKATLRNGLRTGLHERRECATHTYIYICYHTMVSNTAATWLIDVLNHENYTIIIVQQLHLINTCRFLTQVIANLTPKQGAFIKNHLSPRLTVTRLSSNFQLLLATIPLLVTLVQTIELPQIDRCSWHVYHIARPAQLNNK